MIGLARGCAEHAQRAVTVELVDHAALGFDHSHHGGEEVVEPLDHLRRRQELGHGGGPDHVDEERRRLPLLAAELAVEREPRHLRSDVVAEQGLEPLALAQAGDHAVDALLEVADLAGGVDDDPNVEVALPHLPEREAKIAQRCR